MKKRGELTSQEIIALFGIIVAGVLSFLFLFQYFDNSGQNDRNLCQLSIFTRATTPEVLQRHLPLKCTTEKICLTTGDDCKQFAGEQNIRKIKLSATRKEESAKKIEQIVANGMHDCWSMTGEGKLDLFGDSFNLNVIDNIKTYADLGQKGATCLVCSRIAVSENLQKTGILDMVNVNEYMEKNLVPGTDKNYIERLTNSQVNSIPGDLQRNFSDPSNQKEGTDQMAIIFAQVKTRNDPWTAFSEGTIVSGTAIFVSSVGLGGFGTVLKHPLLVIGAGVIGGIATGGLKAYGAYKGQDFSVGYCGKFTSSEENKYGCSIVTQADWNKANEINSLCSGGIEGNL